jgi:hypothetical protein
MKKSILSVLMLTMVMAVSAQARFELGVKGGVNLASLNSDDSNTDGNVTAYHGGAYGLIKIAKFGIQPEVLFSKRGSEEVDLGYLDIPIIAKYYVAGGFNLQAGPQFGVLLNAENDNGDDVSDFLKGSDLSAAVGAGLDLPMGLNLTARYIIGISDVNDVGGDKITNNVFQLSVGYSLFKLGK